MNQLSTYELDIVRKYIADNRNYDAAKKMLDESQTKLDRALKGRTLPLRILVDNSIVVMAYNRSAKSVQVHTMAIDGVYQDGNQIKLVTNPLAAGPIPNWGGQ